MVFAMIFTIIMIGAILALGMGQIQDFFCFGSNAQTNKAINDVESLAEEVFLLSKGSSKTYELPIPADTKLCFLNPESPEKVVPYTDTSMTWNPDRIVQELLTDPLSPYRGSNLWIRYCGSTAGEGYTIEYLRPSKSFCAVQGVTLFFENSGPSVDISPL